MQKWCSIYSFLRTPVTTTSTMTANVLCGRAISPYYNAGKTDKVVDSVPQENLAAIHNEIVRGSANYLVSPSAT